MVIRTNILSLNAHRNVKNTGKIRSANRLSSGHRVNSAADDAAGLAISENMRAQIRGLDQASSNAQDGISLVQTAEGAIQTINDKLGRIRELVVQAANDTNTFEQREMIQEEIDQLMREINATALRTEFNGMRVLDGSVGEIRIPATERPAETIIAHDFSIITGTDGTGAEIESLYNEFLMIPMPPIGTLEEFQDVAERLSAVVTTAHNAFIDIIDTVNGFIAELGDTAFDASSLVDFRNAVENHLHGGNYNNLFFEPTMRGIENTLAQTDDANAARAWLLVAFTGNDTIVTNEGQGLGGAWGLNGTGMVHCHTTIADMAWQFLSTSPALIIPPIMGSGLWFQTGANSHQGMAVTISGMTTTHLGVPIGDLADFIDVRHETGHPISAQLSLLDRAIPRALEERAKLGAVQNRLNYTMRSLDISSENLQDSESRIRNADIAREKMEFLQSAVIRQAGILKLAQANQVPNNLLELLR